MPYSALGLALDSALGLALDSDPSCCPGFNPIDSYYNHEPCQALPGGVAAGRSGHRIYVITVWARVTVRATGLGLQG